MKQEQLKVNLGCGDTTLPGWVNLDNSYGIIMARYPRVATIFSRAGLFDKNWWFKWMDKNVQWRDIRKGLPFTDGSVRYIYSSHLLEHLAPGEAEKLLRECRRMLRSDGLLRLVTPDLEHLFLMYNSLKKDFDPDKPEGKDIPADLFIKCLGIVPGHLWPDYKPTPGLLKRQSKHTHRWLYDFDSLYVLLRKIGFKEINRAVVKKGEMADIELLEENYTHPESLFVEARP